MTDEERSDEQQKRMLEEKVKEDQKRAAALTKFNEAIYQLMVADGKLDATKRVCAKMENDARARMGTARQQVKAARAAYFEARQKLLRHVPDLPSTLEEEETGVAGDAALAPSNLPS